MKGSFPYFLKFFQPLNPNITHLPKTFPLSHYIYKQSSLSPARQSKPWKHLEVGSDCTPSLSFLMATSVLPPGLSTVLHGAPVPLRKLSLPLGIPSPHRLRLVIALFWPLPSLGPRPSLWFPSQRAESSYGCFLSVTCGYTYI